MAQITKFDDVIDLRDVMARVEELEGERDACDAEAFEEWQNSEDAEELATLCNFLQECKGNGGDEQWRGDWYPVTAVRDSHFERYAEELANDIGAIPDGAQWPITCIDWTQAARELQYDYTGVEFDGVTYYVR